MLKSSGKRAIKKYWHEAFSFLLHSFSRFLMVFFFTFIQCCALSRMGILTGWVQTTTGLPSPQTISSWVPCPGQEWGNWARNPLSHGPTTLAHSKWMTLQSITTPVSGDARYLDWEWAGPHGVCPHRYAVCPGWAGHLRHYGDCAWHNPPHAHTQPHTGVGGNSKGWVGARIGRLAEPEVPRKGEQVAEKQR